MKFYLDTSKYLQSLAGYIQVGCIISHVRVLLDLTKVMENYDVNSKTLEPSI